jgi:hypothetical protein
MKPEIFLDEFERTEYGDAYYGAIGRALYFVTRFESNCRGLATIINFKQNTDLLDEPLINSEKYHIAIAKILWIMKLQKKD